MTYHIHKSLPTFPLSLKRTIYNRISIPLRESFSKTDGKYNNDTLVKTRMLKKTNKKDFKGSTSPKLPAVLIEIDAQ